MTANVSSIYIGRKADCIHMSLHRNNWGQIPSKFCQTGNIILKFEKLADHDMKSENTPVVLAMHCTITKLYFINGSKADIKFFKNMAMWPLIFGKKGTSNPLPLCSLKSKNLSLLS